MIKSFQVFTTLMRLLFFQPGDVVVRRGHCGIIVESNGSLYYLESGGRAVPANCDKMVSAEKGLAVFARRRPVMVRRVLPDYK